jgi:hypothetical protein
MITRRSFLRNSVLAAWTVVGASVSLEGCGGGPFMSDLQVSATEIVPDGSGVHDEADISYSLTRRAEVSAQLIGPDGKQYVIRAPQLRTPDQYQIPFKGLVQVPNTNWLRVLPDGTYKLIVQAKDTSGVVISRDTSIKISNADTTPPNITNVLVYPATFSPNGDGIDDTTKLNYKLDKDSMVRVYATDPAGGFYLIQPSDTYHAALQSVEWAGTTAGSNEVLPDGPYTIHIEATDAAGNFTDATADVAILNGGTPRVEITDARFAPTALAAGMDLSVTITVKNTGTVPVRTQGPPPSAKYTTDMNFSSFLDPKDPTRALYFEKPGVWRVGVSWQNAPQNFPVRWGFFEDLTRQLMPGESATIQGTITVLVKTQHSQVFYAGLAQEGVGFPGGQVGSKIVTISF